MIATSQSGKQIGVLLIFLLANGCGLPLGSMKPDGFFKKHYCLPGSQSNTLAGPYRYKNPQPPRTAPHRFVVVDRYTGNEFGVVLRGLLACPSKPEFDEYTDRSIDSSFFHERDLFLLKTSIEPLPNGDVRAMAYVLGQASVGLDLSTGESITAPIWYHLPELSCLYFGEAMLNEEDTTCPLFGPMKTIQEYATKQEQGFWDPEQKWRDKLHRWKNHEEKQRRDIRDSYLKQFNMSADWVKGIPKPEDIRADIDYSMEMNLEKLIDCSQRVGCEKKAADVLRGVIEETTNTETKAMAILSLACVAQEDTSVFLNELSKGQDPVVKACVSYALALLDPRLPIPGIDNLSGSANARVRAKAVYVLGKIADGRAVPALVGLLKDADPTVKRQALRALGHIHDRSVMPAIVAVLSDQNPGVRAWAISTVEDLTGETFAQDETGARRAIAWWEKHKDDPAFSQKQKETSANK